MSSQKHRVEEIFAVAIALSNPAARQTYLDQACHGDALLRQELESLLGAHDALEVATCAATNAPTTAAPNYLSSEQSGTRIGRYKLLEKIGEGGFGDVWMAEQEEPVRRRVALKIIKLGMDTKEVVARFAAERQALALMDHPNIARVFDGGATENGRPYFVMELVRGDPITRFCDEQRLNLTERIELFIQVVYAVQHAHGKGIVHRDLKPSNILVSLHDSKPVPKVIDFGIAKATQQRLTEQTLFTRYNQFVGTPAYMSPEQAGAGAAEIDGRSDVYSLGVLLYELLTGRTPFETQKLLDAGFDTALRTIREVEPAKPSTRLSALSSPELSTVAQGRRTDPRKLCHLLRSGLDWIVMRALEKDRNRRYSTAQALAEDLERYLRNETIQAGPPRVGDRIKVGLRRHRVWLQAGAMLLLVIVTSLMAWRKPHVGTGEFSSGQVTKTVLPERIAALSAAEVLKIAYSGQPPTAPVPALQPRCQLEIFVQRQGVPKPIILQDGDSVRSKIDRYLILVRPLSTGYLYVFQVDSTGKHDWLFPRHARSQWSSGSNPVPSNQVIRVPGSPGELEGTAKSTGLESTLPGFILDENTGIEHVYAVFSAGRWLELEQALARSRADTASPRSGDLARTVQEPNHLHYRGVGGISTNSLELDLAKAFPPSAFGHSDSWLYPGRTFAATNGFLLIERWFKHVDQL